MIIHDVATAYTFNNEFTKILMVKHRLLNLWLPPGGHVQSNEIILDTAKRELKEEAGIEATLLDFNNQRVFHRNTFDGKSYVEIYRPFAIIKELIPKTTKATEHWHIDHIYIFQTNDVPLPCSSDSGVSEVSWVEIGNLDHYPTSPNVVIIIGLIMSMKTKFLARLDHQD